MTTAAAK